MCGLPLHLHPLSEPCEASGSKPGGVATSPGWGADFGGLIEEPSSYSLLCWGLRGLWALGACCLCSCTEALLQLLICLPPHYPRLPLWPWSLLWSDSLASCLSIGLCSKAACPPSPAEALRLEPWQLEVTTVQEGSSGIHRGPGRPSFPPLGLLLGLLTCSWPHSFFSHLLLPLNGWIVLFFLPTIMLLSSIFKYSFNIYLVPTVYDCRCSEQSIQILTWN